MIACNNNVFVKFLILYTKSFDGTFLYGFSAETHLPERDWRVRSFNSSPRKIVTTVLAENKASELFSAMESGECIQLSDDIHIKVKLIKRKGVLYQSGQVDIQDAPFSSYQLLTEYWNTEKSTLLRQIKRMLNVEGKEYYKNMQEILAWAKDECGIDFSKNGRRFGNFESFNNPFYSKIFEVTVDKESGLLNATIKKLCSFDDDLIVRCASEHRGRWILDEVKWFPSNIEALQFSAEEPMSRVLVQVWDANRGNLIFSTDETLMMSLKISMNISSSSRKIIDPWSEKLRKAASNRSDKIDKIENVRHYSKDRDIVVKSPTHNSIDAAMAEGDQLLSLFRKVKQKGIFIPQFEKDGEIDSFMKIREYLEAQTLERVIIADPYFSVESAARMLGRIENKRLKLEIVTSLGMKNPDTGEVSDACASCRTFLANNAHTLHQNLYVINLKRGKEPVFHDRYLIRYHMDGSIDGFLLSNSLNSAGQKFPFVVAPMEHEVTLDVCEYIEAMCSESVQSGIRKQQRIMQEILFSPTKKVESVPFIQTESCLHKVLANQLSEDNVNGAEIIERKLLQKSEGLLHFAKDDLPYLVNAAWSYDADNLRDIYITIGEIADYIYCWSPKEIANQIIKVKGAKKQFTCQFANFAIEVEVRQNHAQKNINSAQYTFWSLLKGNAMPSKQGIGLLLTRFEPVWYSDTPYIHGAYSILLELMSEHFLSVMQEIYSPMMLYVLTKRMSCRDWDGAIYSALSNNPTEWLRALAAEWLNTQFHNEGRSFQWAHTILCKLAPKIRFLQSICLLSRGAFYARTNNMNEGQRNEWNKLKTFLLELIENDMLQTEQECFMPAIEWLGDCEQVSNFGLHFEIALLTDNVVYRSTLLEKAINIALDALVRYPAADNCGELIELLIMGLDMRYENGAEHVILSKIVSFDAFELATEPVRQDYGYENWHNARQRAIWQLNLLKTYNEKHLDAQKIQKCINEWNLVTF